ncbi:hypothetical protein N1937_30845 (plasmid) [Rhizobium sp. WSM4643]|uniref:hypothetical protein n=1 Tax=Rhizobium sp. WSM4643 TaxID=3138253 RepID=UPI0021A55A03|nr:hypothetical protein [Rhizobium leguminosarum]UWM79244.1 hypothetical protein N1937_30845 [Rhizobium leguminosarum bv. viciae]
MGRRQQVVLADCHLDPPNLPEVTHTTAARKKIKAMSRISASLRQPGAGKLRAIACRTFGNRGDVTRYLKTGCGDFFEKTFKATRRQHRDANSPVGTGAEAMTLATWDMRNLHRTAPKHGALKFEINDAFQHKESFVLGLMDVRRRALKRAGNAVDDGHGALRFGRGQQDAIGGAIPAMRLLWLGIYVHDTGTFVVG